jgi:hypothetical protein
MTTVTQEREGKRDLLEGSQNIFWANKNEVSK